MSGDLHDTGPGSAAQGGEVHADNVAGRDIILPAPDDATASRLFLMQQIVDLRRDIGPLCALPDRIDKIEEAQARHDASLYGDHKSQGVVTRVASIQKTLWIYGIIWLISFSLLAFLMLSVWSGVQ